MANRKTTKTNTAKVKKKKAKKKVEKKPLLTPKQMVFCRLYATTEDCFGNGTMAYKEAFSTKRKPVYYLTAKSGAWRLLSMPHVCTRINKLLEEMALNDQFVDKQLAFLISQHADKSSKLGGIREYNKLKNRVSGFDTDDNKLPFIIKVMPMQDDKKNKPKPNTAGEKDQDVQEAV